MSNEAITIIVENTVNSTDISVTSEDLNISLEITEASNDVSVLAVEEVNEISIDVTNQVQEVTVFVTESRTESNFTLSDDLIVVTAGKQSNTFNNNVFTFTDTPEYTNNSKTLLYTGALLTGARHLFNHSSQSWAVDYTYNYDSGNYNGVSKTITKS